VIEIEQEVMTLPEFVDEINYFALKIYQVYLSLKYVS
jgi:hypothetical protein